MWRNAVKTDVGLVRSRNEDSVLALPDKGLWCVADGMGGHSQGDVASRMVVEHLSELPLSGSIQDKVTQTCQCLRKVNRLLTQDLTILAGETSSVIGTTVVILIADGKDVACIWAGDSRCYIQRGDFLYQITRDHCYAEQLIEQERTSKWAAYRHPSSRALTNAIGATDDLSLDVIFFKQYRGDVFLLCSDGLYQSIPAADICSAMQMKSPSLAVNRLLSKCLLGPANDNISVVIVKDAVGI